MTTYNRELFFDSVRTDPFPSGLKQSQVDGMEAILDAWEDDYGHLDPRWLAYALSTAMWETSSEMLPIEEYGKGGDADYAKVDPETGQAYYGRGLVQLTWRDNYRKADVELGLDGDDSCEWDATNALDPTIASDIMFEGMIEGWFRSDEEGKQTLGRYFSETVDNPFEAREIINGDKTKVPSWAAGARIGDLIAGYHHAFLTALEASAEPDEEVALVEKELGDAVGEGKIAENREQEHPRDEEGGPSPGPGRRRGAEPGPEKRRQGKDPAGKKG